MSYNIDLKNEILENRPLRVRHKKAYAYGLLLFAQLFGQEMRFSTEHKGIARLYASAATSVVGIAGSVTTYTHIQAGKTVYDVQVDSSEDSVAIQQFFHHEADTIQIEVFQSDEDIAAFCSGAFLACGSMHDPQKNYHLEFLLPRAGLEESFARLLDGMGYTPLVTERRGQRVLFFRDSEQIEGLLAIMGATRQALDLMNIKIYKDIRNKANRQKNCDTANIDKAISAGAKQLQQIQLIKERLGLESLEDDLRAMVEVRLAHPEASLRELADLMTPPLSRSGVNHRLARLKKIAEELEAEEKAGKKKNG
ncbi:MAG: DNA-binding protein WhiA [Oscillospiraceae bacterium]|nr:DNA-binding protein WhiA [Oscillospiraceae bacterium]